MSIKKTSRAIALDQKLDSIAYEIAARKVLLAGLNVQRNLKYDPDQPRVPAGNPGGGQWSGGGGSSHTLKNPMSHDGISYRNAKGNTECVTFAQQAGGAGPTKDWKPGEAISPSNPPLQGTWVATFVDGHYYGHVGAFMGYEPDGTLILLDQFNKKGQVSIQRYSPKPQPFSGRISNNPSKYRVVLW
ncbi:MAG: BPSL0067 family protein [Rhizomicrobium sp.]